MYTVNDIDINIANFQRIQLQFKFKMYAKTITKSQKTQSYEKDSASSYTVPKKKNKLKDTINQLQSLYSRLKPSEIPRKNIQNDIIPSPYKKYYNFNQNKCYSDQPWIVALQQILRLTIKIHDLNQSKNCRLNMKDVLLNNLIAMQHLKNTPQGQIQVLRYISTVNQLFLSQQRGIMRQSLSQLIRHNTDEIGAPLSEKTINYLMISLSEKHYEKNQQKKAKNIKYLQNLVCQMLHTLENLNVNWQLIVNIFKHYFKQALNQKDQILYSHCLKSYFQFMFVLIKKGVFLVQIPPTIQEMSLTSEKNKQISLLLNLDKLILTLLKSFPKATKKNGLYFVETYVSRIIPQLEKIHRNLVNQKLYSLFQHTINYIEENHHMNFNSSLGYIFTFMLHPQRKELIQSLVDPTYWESCSDMKNLKGVKVFKFLASINVNLDRVINRQTNGKTLKCLYVKMEQFLKEKEDYFLIGYTDCINLVIFLLDKIEQFKANYLICEVYNPIITISSLQNLQSNQLLQKQLQATRWVQIVKLQSLIIQSKIVRTKEFTAFKPALAINFYLELTSLWANFRRFGQPKQFNNQVSYLFSTINDRLSPRNFESKQKHQKVVPTILSTTLMYFYYFLKSQNKKEAYFVIQKLISHESNQDEAFLSTRNVDFMLCKIMENLIQKVQNLQEKVLNLFYDKQILIILVKKVNYLVSNMVKQMDEQNKNKKKLKMFILVARKLIFAFCSFETILQKNQKKMIQKVIDNYIRFEHQASIYEKIPLLKKTFEFQILDIYSKFLRNSQRENSINELVPALIQIQVQWYTKIIAKKSMLSDKTLIQNQKLEAIDFIFTLKGKINQSLYYLKSDFFLNKTEEDIKQIERVQINTQTSISQLLGSQPKIYLQTLQIKMQGNKMFDLEYFPVYTNILAKSIYLTFSAKDSQKMSQMQDQLENATIHAKKIWIKLEKYACYFQSYVAQMKRHTKEKQCSTITNLLSLFDVTSSKHYQQRQGIQSFISHLSVIINVMHVTGFPNRSIVSQVQRLYLSLLYWNNQNSFAVQLAKNIFYLEADKSFAGIQGNANESFYLISEKKKNKQFQFKLIQLYLQNFISNYKIVNNYLDLFLNRKKDWISFMQTKQMVRRIHKCIILAQQPKTAINQQIVIKWLCSSLLAELFKNLTAPQSALHAQFQLQYKQDQYQSKSSKFISSQGPQQLQTKIKNDSINRKQSVKVDFIQVAHKLISIAIKSFIQSILEKHQISQIATILQAGLRYFLKTRNTSQFLALNCYKNYCQVQLSPDKKFQFQIGNIFDNVWPLVIFQNTEQNQFSKKYDKLYKNFRKIFESKRRSVSIDINLHNFCKTLKQIDQQAISRPLIFLLALYFIRQFNLPIHYLVKQGVEISFLHRQNYNILAKQTQTLQALDFSTAKQILNFIKDIVKRLKLSVRQNYFQAQIYESILGSVYDSLYENYSDYDNHDWSLFNDLICDISIIMMEHNYEYKKFSMGLLHLSINDQNWWQSIRKNNQRYYSYLVGCFLNNTFENQKNNQSKQSKAKKIEKNNPEQLIDAIIKYAKLQKFHPISIFYPLGNRVYNIALLNQILVTSFDRFVFQNTQQTVKNLIKVNTQLHRQIKDKKVSMSVYRQKKNGLNRQLGKIVMNQFLGVWDIDSLNLGSQGANLQKDILKNDCKAYKKIVGYQNNQIYAYFSSFIKEDQLGRICQYSQKMANWYLEKVDRQKKQKTNSAIRKIPKQQQKGNILIYIHEKYLQFPFEVNKNLSKYHGIYRIPSIKYIIEQESSKKVYRISCLNYLVNSTQDLNQTEENFNKIVKNFPDWRGIIGRKPSVQQFRSILDSYFFLYMGHGTGSSHLKQSQFYQIDKPAVSLLFGCGSVKMVQQNTQPHGVPFNYLIKKCPSVLGCLWQVTDQDIDKLTILMFKMIKLATEQSKNPVQYLNLSQVLQACKSFLRDNHLNGSATVIYGVPVYIKS